MWVESKKTPGLSSQHVVCFLTVLRSGLSFMDSTGTTALLNSEVRRKSLAESLNAGVCNTCGRALVGHTDLLWYVPQDFRQASKCQFHRPGTCVSNAILSSCRIEQERSVAWHINLLYVLLLRYGLSFQAARRQQPRITARHSLQNLLVCLWQALRREAIYRNIPMHPLHYDVSHNEHVGCQV